MSEQMKRWNVPRGTTVSESPHGEFYHCADFDTLTQRLQEAERLLEEAGGWLPSLRLNGYAKTTELSDKIDAFLAGKGDKP